MKPLLLRTEDSFIVGENSGYISTYEDSINIEDRGRQLKNNMAFLQNIDGEVFAASNAGEFVRIDLHFSKTDIWFKNFFTSKASRPSKDIKLNLFAVECLKIGPF